MRSHERLELTLGLVLLRLGSHKARVTLHQPGRAPVFVNTELDGKEKGQVRVEFPAAAVPVGRFVELCFEIENPTAPAGKVASSSDQRKLGVGLVSLEARVC
jgi:hypothetical protein